jgi:hypothetical protein
MPSERAALPFTPMNECFGQMMDSSMMGSPMMMLMMAGGGLVFLLILAILIMSVLALFKYLRGRK